MVFTQHAFLERLRNNQIILRDPRSGVRHQYSAEQLRLYWLFDQALREDRVAGPGHIVPGGYGPFRDIWAQDSNNPIQFSEYSPDSGVVVIHGNAVDIDELAPLPGRTQAATTPLGSVTTGLDPRRQAVLDNLIWDQLYRNQRGRDAFLQRREKRIRAEEANPLVIAPAPNTAAGHDDRTNKRVRTEPLTTQAPGAGPSGTEGATAGPSGSSTGSGTPAAKRASTRDKRSSSKPGAGSSSKKDAGKGPDRDGDAGAAGTVDDGSTELMDYE